MIIIGLMSGTSADGVDAVCVQIDGAPPSLCWKLIQHVHVPYPPEVREDVFLAFRPETARIDKICELNFRLGSFLADAVLEVCRTANIPTSEVSAVGSHGQTVWHIPPGSKQQASTLQLGSSAVIAQRTGIMTVSDFRSADIAAGGQGAPLVPYVDYLLLTHPIYTRAVQNIGGIGNVTFLPASGNAEQIIAFDTGPGNMLMDYTAQRISGGALLFDKDGKIALSGKVCETLLNVWMKDPYYLKQPPKSTGREYFGTQYGARLFQEALDFGLSSEDTMATVTALTARSIADAYTRFLPSIPEEVFVSGGGAFNPTLMRRLASDLPQCSLRTTDSQGIPSSAKEALAFAILAYETIHHRTGNLPSATGASRPVILGSLTYPV